MYIITARRITSGEELKYRNGLRIAGGYGTSLPGSSQFTLTTPIEALRSDPLAAIKGSQSDPLDAINKLRQGVQ